MNPRHTHIRNLFNAIMSDDTVSLTKKIQMANVAINGILEQKAFSEEHKRKHGEAKIDPADAAAIDLDYHAKGIGTALCQAIKKGYTDIVIALINAGARIEKAYSVGHVSPLSVAAASDYLNIVRLLLNQDFYKQDEKRLLNPLIVASQQGNIQIVNALLAAKTMFHPTEKAKPDECPVGTLTPLTYAIDENHIAVVKQLLKAGANPHHPNELDRMTPFYHAVAKRNYDLVEVLLHQSNFSSLDKTMLIDPLICAISLEDITLVQRILHEEPELHFLPPEHQSALLTLLAKELRPLAVDQYPEEFIIDIGYVLLKQYLPENEVKWINENNKTMLLALGTYFIEAFSKHQIPEMDPTLWDGFYTELSNRLILADDKLFFQDPDYLTASSLYELKQNDNFHNTTKDFLIRDFAKLFGPYSIGKLELFMMDCLLIHKALAQHNSELAEYLKEYDVASEERPLEKIKYCNYIMRYLEDYRIGLNAEAIPDEPAYDEPIAVVFHEHEVEEKKQELPQHKIDRLAKAIRNEEITLDNVIETYHELAKAYRDIAKIEESKNNLTLSKDLYKCASKMYGMALKYNKNPTARESFGEERQTELTTFAETLKSEFIELCSKISASNNISRPSIAGTFGTQTQTQNTPAQNDPVHNNKKSDQNRPSR